MMPHRPTQKTACAAAASPALSTRLLPLLALLLLAGLAALPTGSRAADEEDKKLRVIQPNALKAKAEAAGTIVKHPTVTPEQLKETVEAAKGKSQVVNLVPTERKGEPAARPAAASAAHGAAAAPAHAAPAAVDPSIAAARAAAHGYRPPSYTPSTSAPITHLADAVPARATGHAAPAAHAAVPVAAGSAANSREYIRARAAALAGHTPDAGGHGDGHDIHWAYEGEGGPQAWGKLKPEFNLCASGKRQSPIHIESSNTLLGPAEPLQFNYWPSNGTVVNNGHTIQVDVDGDNAISVRGSTYRLVQFHFHHPSEERINYKTFAMVAHLVHRNAEGQLAVVAVLIEPGQASSFMQKVWTYMPLDNGDKVRMPPNLVDINEFLPKDQRYFQFMGSLTTPPCSEGVLWLVLKTPVTASREQVRMFSQLFPNNARPVQPVNARVVREAQ